MAKRKDQPGQVETEFPQTPYLLLEKEIPKHNILVGDDSIQVRFVENLLGIPCVLMPYVRDSDFLGKDEPQLFRVEVSRSIDLSQSVRRKTGVWSLYPLTDETPGIETIVKFAAEMLDEKPGRKHVNKVTRRMEKEDIGDIRAAIWEAFWLLLGEEEPDYQEWPQPWSNSMTWFPFGKEPSYRLNALYRDLVGYVYARDDDQGAARKFGIGAKRFAKLKALHLSLDKVEETIAELSRWRSQKYDPYICALKISRIWSRTPVL